MSDEKKDPEKEVDKIDKVDAEAAEVGEKQNDFVDEFEGRELPEIIKHEPIRAVEKARPVQPSAASERKSWSISRIAGLRMVFIFCLASLVIYFIMMSNHNKVKVSNPVHNIELKDLKLEVKKNLQMIENTEDQDMKKDLKATNEELIQRIRELDLHLRTYYFSLKDRKEPGTWFLFICLIGFFLSFRFVWGLKPDTPKPVPDYEKGEEQLRERHYGRNAVLTFSILFIGVCAITHTVQSKPPGALYAQVVSAQAGPAIDPTSVASAEEFSNNWPWLSGARTQEEIAKNTYPTSFDLTAGTNVKWKAQIPMGGASSAVIWDKHIFVAAANKGKRSLYCYSLDTGKRKWEAPAKSEKSKKAPVVFEEYMFAASTPATDGRRVYAIFANGDLIATDMKGKIIWQKDLGLPEDDYGHSSSLLCHENKLIVMWDHVGDGSAIFVFDGLTGEEKLKIDRSDYQTSWRSPILVNADGKNQLIISNNKLTSYDLSNGDKLWEFNGTEGDVGSSPFYHDGVLYANAEEEKFVAIALEGENKNKILWKNEEMSVPDVPSPVSDGKYVWTVDGSGTLTCLDAKTGKEVYNHDLEVEVYASPLIIGDKILICSTEGKVLFMKMGDKFEEVSSTDTKLAIHPTPSLSKNRIIFRADKEIFCVEQK